MERQGNEIIDKKDKDGSLWIVGGEELEPFINELRIRNINFIFVKNESRSTQRRAGWFSSNKD